MSTRKTRVKKDEIQKGAGSEQSKDRNTNARVAAIADAKRTKKKPTSETSQKPAPRKRATTASKEATIKGSRGITEKKLKGTDSKEYKQKSAKHTRSAWQKLQEQIHTHNPGRIYNEDNTRGLGVRKTEQNAMNIGSSQVYDQGASVYGEGHLYRTNQSTSQYPPYDREGYAGQQQGFRDDFNYDDRYWWEGQFPQGASSWEGDGRWQHHDRPWEHRQNQQGHRSNAPYGGDYERHRWLQGQREGRVQHSEDYQRGLSRGNMTWGEAIYPDDQRLREDIYQDPGLNYDRMNEGYYQAYSGGDDIGHVPDADDWNENQGGSHFHRDDVDWKNFDAKRRDMYDYELRGRRDENERRRSESTRGSWGPRDEYTPKSYTPESYRDQGQQRDNMHHSRSLGMQNRIMDYIDETTEDRNRRMRTVWTNTLDEPYMGGYNEKTPQSDRRVVGQGGYNQGGYGKQGYSQEYGNAGGYGSTGAYQSGHRGEHRRGDYHEGYIYDERQDRFAEKGMNRDRPGYDESYIAGSDDRSFEDVRHSYKARLHQEDERPDTGQFEGNVHGMRHYGEGEGSKWKNLGKSHTKRSQR
jgi:hypothetical protein